MFSAILMLLLGLFLTVKGGDLFVDAAVWFANALGVPKFLVGATVVSLATTLPELAVSLLATARGAAGIAAGNAVGSVSANLGLILGITLCLAPTGLDRRDQGLKLAWMLLAGALLFSLCVGGRLGPVGVALMLGLCVLHLWQSARAGREHLTSRGGRRARLRAAARDPSHARLRHAAEVPPGRQLRRPRLQAHRHVHAAVPQDTAGPSRRA